MLDTKDNFGYNEIFGRIIVFFRPLKCYCYLEKCLHKSITDVCVICHDSTAAICHFTSFFKMVTNFYKKSVLYRSLKLFYCTGKAASWLNNIIMHELVLFFFLTVIIN